MQLTLDQRLMILQNTTANRNSGQYSADNVTGFSFNFASRKFHGTKASETLIPKDNSNINYDFEFYLGRVDLLFLTEKGKFQNSKRNSC